MGDYVPPVPIELPRTKLGLRARRLLQTVAVMGRHLAPVAASRLPGAWNQGPSAARAVRLAFEELGATYVKFGQFVASAPAVVGADVAEEFRSCLDQGPPVPFAQVRATVEEDIGRPLEAAFLQFEEAPMAAASLAVVHRAALKDGRPVAVKVLRPGIPEVVAADLDVMEPLVRFLAAQGLDAAFNLASYLLGLREQVAEELDLVNEARAMVHFRRLFAEFGLTLTVPEVHANLSGPRVLTMEMLEGVPIDDLARIEEMGVDPAPLVHELLRAWLLTGLHAGIFHADIHAGNLLLMPGGRLGLIDWGIVARLDPDTHRLFRRLIEAAVGEESAWDDITAYVIRINGTSLQEGLGLSVEQVARLVRAQMEPLLSRPLREVSMTALFASADELIRLATGEAPPRRSFGERLRLQRRKARANRLAMAQGFIESSFRRANFLASKQLVYLERYARMYLPDRALLGDSEFLAAALNAGPASPGPSSTSG